MVVVLAVLLAAGTPVQQDDRLVDVRTTLNHQLDEVDGIMANLERMLATDSLIDSNMPQLGIVLNSEEQVDEHDGFHPVRVVAVYADGPANTRGIRPGDRILAIGARRLEHETTRIVYALLNEAKSPVQLTISHTGGAPPVVVSVDRVPLECVGRGVRSIDKRAILARVENIRGVSRGARKIVLQHSDDPVILGQIGELKTKLVNSLVVLGANILEELNQQVAVSCRAQLLDD